jgi:hypothetical protein
MAVDERLEGPAQSRDVYFPAYASRKADVIGRALRRPLVLDPERLLIIREGIKKPLLSKQPGGQGALLFI